MGLNLELPHKSTSSGGPASFLLNSSVTGAGSPLLKRGVVSGWDAKPSPTCRSHWPPERGGLVLCGAEKWQDGAPPVSPVKHTVAWLLQGQRQRLGEGTLLDQHQQKEAARRKAREEKARQARRAAIQVRGWPEPCGKPGAEGGPPCAKTTCAPGGPPAPFPETLGVGPWAL